MNRRRFVSGLATAGVAGIPGCVGYVSDSDSERRPEQPVGLLVRNYFGQRRTVSVAIEAVNGDDGYETTMTLLPQDMVRRDRILPAKPYKVTAKVKDEMWKSTNWRMGDCVQDNISVEVGEGGIGISSTCHE